MTTRHTYMCMSVRGGIRNLQQQRGKKTYMTDGVGQPLTKDQAINALMDELAKGREVIPMNPKCGNPCARSVKCAGFDFKDGGCPGYEVDEVPA